MEAEWWWRAAGLAGRVTALILLIVLAPLLAGISLVILLLSRRSPWIALQRVGQYGRPLWIVKFRTMWPRSSAWRRFTWMETVVDDAGPGLKCAGDPRVTSSFARFCRRFSLDELPQLVNVVRGEMSLVGPRPLTGGELTQHYGGAAGEILQYKPGITGLWQVKGRSRLSYEERREMDLCLVRNRSLRLYAEILLRTVPEVLSGKNAW